MTKLISIHEVSEMVSLSISQIRRMVKVGTFPEPIKVGQFRIVWIVEDVDAWIESLRKESNND